ncbi:MAG: hypothetical protein J6B23_09070 [Clostridia bacterium]|nr:hypothetical protein [Clostridia bacterium]
MKNKIFCPIGVGDIQRATQILQKYKQGKTNLEKRIIENEQWWKMQHWSLLQKVNPTDPEPASAWLFNSIANKHADAMDNFPSPCVLPREESDSDAARILSSVLPVVLEYNEFEQTYSDVWWYKLKTGTGCYGVFWNNMLEDGLGDIDIRQIDILNMFWESGIKDIQESRNIFTVELEANDILEEKYPQLKGKLSTPSVDVAQYIYDDTVDTENKSAVIDWYYKKNIGNSEVVHYCKYVGEEILYSSENDENLYERGFYDHGKYPFVMDILFADEGTPCGFGYIDIMKNVQMYIDKLNQIILKNALQSGRRRFFISDNAGINEEEFADWSKEFVHTSGSLDDRSIREIQVSQLDGSIVNILHQKIDELKETSGNRDVSQGGTTTGVVAASAIAALQEAGSKLSRDMIKSSYRAFKKINLLIIELMRQFYDEPRYFRISGNESGNSFSAISSKELRREGELYIKKPIFDIAVSSQKDNPFSTSAQNELAKELYNMGIFNPEMSHQALMCLEMMNFDGREKIIEKIKQNIDNVRQNPPLPIETQTPDTDESYAIRGYKKALPGSGVLTEARRSANR